MKKLLLILFTSLLLLNCKETTQNQSTENFITVVYKISPFHSITNNSIVDIEISDEIPKDEIHFFSTEESLNEIKHEVIDGDLIINTSKKIFSFGENTNITAKINSESIKNFSVNGVGSIISTITLRADHITTDISGAGNLELTIKNKSLINKISGVGNLVLKGNTQLMNTEISGAGNLNGFELIASESINSISGVGNANINVTDKLNAEISGIGNIVYKGEPKEIIKNISGLGSVSRD